MKEYNVLYEPWIPVIRENGERDCLGIIPTLEHAHELKEILCDDPLETYAVQRLLIAFVMDAYWTDDRLKTIADRRTLYQEGRFDKTILNAYVEKCISEGASFDLFDKDRPFMQASYNKDIDEGKSASVSKLFIRLPRDNTPVHFEHCEFEELALKPEKCLPALLATYCFSVAMVQGYPSSVNGTPCYYFLIHEDTLFHTLTLSCISQREQMGHGNHMAVAWRDNHPVVPKESFATMSILAAYTWQPRRISLIRDEDGLIRRIYYQQGKNYVPNGQWRDPHTALRINAKGETFILKPTLGRALWRDLGCFGITQGNSALQPSIVANFLRIKESFVPCPVEAFGIVTNKASLVAMTYDKLNIPDCICTDSEKATRLSQDLLFIEEVASLLGISLLRMEHQIEPLGKIDPKTRRSELTDEAQARFFSDMQPYMMGRYSALLDAADTSSEWENAIVVDINDAVNKSIQRILRESKYTLGTSARQLQAQAGNEKALLSILKKKMKERIAYE